MAESFAARDAGGNVLLLDLLWILPRVVSALSMMRSQQMNKPDYHPRNPSRIRDQTRNPHRDPTPLS